MSEDLSISYLRDGRIRVGIGDVTGKAAGNYSETAETEEDVQAFLFAEQFCQCLVLSMV